MLAWILNKYVWLLRKRWREREPAGYMWPHPASLPEGNRGAAGTPPWPGRHLGIARVCQWKCCHFHNRKKVTCAPFFFPKSFLLGTFLRSTTPPKPKGRETQQSNKVAFNMKMYVSVCAPFCWAQSKGKEPDPGWSLEWETLATSKMPTQPFPMAHLIKSWTSTSNMWALSSIANRS